MTLKTHDLAKALIRLAEILNSGPDVEVGELRLGPSQASLGEARETMAVNLSTLANLSRIDKTQWLSFIRENGLPIQLRPRDASRDILGKVLRYLEEHADAREKLKQSAARKGGQTSPELMKAFSILLGESYGPTSKRD